MSEEETTTVGKEPKRRNMRARIYQQDFWEIGKQEDSIDEGFLLLAKDRVLEAICSCFFLYIAAVSRRKMRELRIQLLLLQLIVKTESEFEPSP